MDKASPHADLVVPAAAHMAGVGLMFALLAATRGTEGLWHGMTNSWDAEIYVRLAEDGYRAPPDGTSDYAFPPLWPSLLSLVGDLRVAWVVNLLLGALGTAFVGRLVGWRGGVLFAVIPTWLWYSSVLYTEALFVATAAGALVAMRLGRFWLAGTCVALAVLTRYVGAIGLAAAIGATLWPLRREPVRIRAALGLLVPAAAVGMGILTWHERAAGSPWAYFDAQDAWGAELWGPRAQVDWILHGWFTNQEVVRDSVPPAHWLYRNLVVEAAVAGGAVLLWLRGHRALAFYSAAILAVLVSTVGMPSISLPRLALAAFPAWAILGARLGTASLAWVVAAGIAAGTWVGSSYLEGFFA